MRGEKRYTDLFHYVPKYSEYRRHQEGNHGVIAEHQLSQILIDPASKEIIGSLFTICYLIKRKQQLLV